MRLFGKRAPEVEKELQPLVHDDRPSAYERFCERANDLPLLTDAELHHFALTGEQVVISSGGPGPTWCQSFNTQFLIRLRRTLLEKIDPSPVPTSDVSE